MPFFCQQEFDDFCARAPRSPVRDFPQSSSGGFPVALVCCGAVRRLETAFMMGCSLLLGLVVAWLAAAAGGQHRDGAVIHHFWRRWEVNKAFLIR